MNTVKLPPRLETDADLAAWNAALKADEASLDWSGVEMASDEALKSLLAGLTPDEHADALGLDTVPEGLVERLEAILFAEPEAPAAADDDDEPETASSDLPAPAVYAPPTGRTEFEARDRAAGTTRYRYEPAERVLKVPSPAEIRAELHGLLRADLLGPRGGADEELVEGRPRDQYLVGVLAPRNTFMDVEAQDDAAREEDASDDDGDNDAETTNRNSLWPSSHGMTFSVRRDAQKLRLTVRFGSYERVASDILFDDDGNPKRVWRRRQAANTWEPELRSGVYPRWAPSENHPEVYIELLVRDRADEWSITVFLVNAQSEPAKNKDAAWLFQPSIRVEGAGDDEPVLQCRPPAVKLSELDSKTAEEQATAAMLYRHELEFAVGHSTAVKAERDPSNPHRALFIETDPFPSFEVQFQESPRPEQVPELEGLQLDMQWLATAPKGELLASLGHLPRAYSVWIGDQAQRLEEGRDGLDEHREAGKQALANARTTLERIEEGIGVLRDDDTALEAFRFANRSMAMQRIRSKFAESRRRGSKAGLEEIDVPKNRSWRVFQLGFLMLNLPALADLHHQDRSDASSAIADLLWFPTGGGKTEAYLGVAAFTMGIRRLQGMVAGRNGRDGLAVLMRYTLRLLTIQQFQRASALICACEVIRREDEDKWGKTPFRIGLWVGYRTTPNTTDQAHEAIKLEHKVGGFNDNRGSGSPVQLKYCPWCGNEIDPGKNMTVISFNKGEGRTLTYCGDPKGQCDFSSRRSEREGIPVVVVDEEIYRLLPSLVIATVDKFAQLPWKGATQMLFGQVQRRCPRHGFVSPTIDDPPTHRKSGHLPSVKSVETSLLRPPDLIIQDELHLISGPLGTLVGLYETVIDELSTWEVRGRRVRPKVIASTATIRRADEQIRALFNRTVAIFPPNGLESTDNFFSKRVPKDERPGRLYLGICAPGRRVKSTQIRVFTTLLGASQLLFEKYGEAADPWMTTVGYFNSIRELAGARRSVEDDVRNRLRDIHKRGLGRRTRVILEELTSRKKSGEIPEILDRMELNHQPEDKGTKRKKIPFRQRPLDVLLATNMISVGVDVGRLGAMIAVGQPKTTAEYIQATSRVGRTHPGVVCTIYNWARPRDLSHYENFEAYHSTFYRHVEALSLTPFATRALDRGLFALLVALVRNLGFDFNDNADAGKITPGLEVAKRAIERIAARGEDVTHSKKVAEDIVKRLQRRWDRWHELALSTKKQHARLGYRSKRDGETVGLLRQAGDGDWDETTCLNSLREVEPQVGLVLLDGQMDDLPQFGEVP
jgi:hypothetical protein